MIIRDRINVTQVYRSVYDATTKRSRTMYVGAFAKYGEPSPELLATLTEPERRRLERFIAARAEAHEAILGRTLFTGAPAELRRVAAWLRRQPKSPAILRGAKALRDAYAELYAVMRQLGVARLRETSARSAKRAARGSPVTLGAGMAADALIPAPQQEPAAPGGAPAGAAQGTPAALPAQS